MQKTKIYESKAFIDHCAQMLQTDLSNRQEVEEFEILHKHAADFTLKFSIDDLSVADELQAFSVEKVEQILSQYFLYFFGGMNPIMHVLDGLLRRFSVQIRMPTAAIEFCIKQIDGSKFQQIVICYVVILLPLVNKYV
ncbi:MAG: hypothetical protein U0175_20270 [Caldilineaceae bacterium]